MDIIDKIKQLDYYTEIRSFLEFFIEAFFVLITIQLVSDKVDNNSIVIFKEIKVSLLIAVILYIAKCINTDLNQNIRQGFCYIISGVFLSKYHVV